MAVTRQARASWAGTIVQGGGNIAVGSGAFPAQPFSLPTRIGEPGGQTSPEELLAAAQASCLAMEIAAQLTGRGTPATALEVSASCTEGPVADGFAITSMELTVTGSAPEIDQPAFAALVEAAARSCPIARALAGSVPLTVTATLI